MQLKKNKDEFEDDFLQYIEDKKNVKLQEQRNARDRESMKKQTEEFVKWKRIVDLEYSK